MENLQFVPTEWPPWREGSSVSTSEMITLIQQHFVKIEHMQSIESIFGVEFRKATFLHFVHSVAAIEGESLNSVDESSQAIKLWMHFKDVAKQTTAGIPDEMLHYPTSYLETGFKELSNIEKCLCGVEGLTWSLNKDKVHATVALHDAVEEVAKWEISPYPQLTDSKICLLHSMLFKESTDWHSAGVFRKGSVFTRLMRGGVHTYLGYRKIPMALNKLVSETNSIISDVFKPENRPEFASKLLKAVARFFMDFQSIHPFHDGNGRVGRLLAAYLLRPLTPFGLNVFYYHSPLSTLGQVTFVERETFLYALQDDVEDEVPMRMCAMFCEGIYVAWEVYLAARPLSVTDT